MEQAQPLPQWAKSLGYLGLAPQFLAVAMVLAGGEWRWIGLAGGFAYAALIFSFLGGIWWAQVLTLPAPGRLLPLAAIAPSLIALACFLPWFWGHEWPGPSLAVLGLCLLLSPLADRQIAALMPLPPGWLAMRVRLSAGLGLATLVLAAV